MRLEPEIEELLVAFWNGELTKSEEEKVQEWLSSDDAHQKVYRDFMCDYLRLRWVFENQYISEEEVKNKVLSSLKKRRRRWLYFSSVAALVAGICLLVVVLLPEKKSLQQPSVAGTEISSIHKQALLILSTGKEVVLAAQNQEILERNGSKLVVDSVHGICYDSCVLTGKEKQIYNKIVVPRGGEYMIGLCDGTKVWLDADSELEYPVVFSGDFRDVKLKGQAYFSVAKNPDKPFVVSVNGYSLRVYGTEFNINAYDLHRIQTALVNGEISIKVSASSVEKFLKPNDLAVSNIATGKSSVRQTDIYPYIAWKNQNIVFVDENLERIMQDIARWYDVEVVFEDESLKKMRFDCNMHRYADIRQLFVFMERTSDARFIIDGKIVKVSKNKH